ncbi:16S rRNA (cytosine(1402)-N(4))-methyltransferase [Candidatus Wolfebacteria bacterium GWA1_42_9]|uniref:Ribosomal RNA small subunit methyltransferase H n=1 Tax=Candidatus Wolfebacteria bacterium GWA1_42_9 TaxID=1802553 RepID=A0A1F8DNY8_9BACT|nr:MAG: Ribosomal RNA small subunit methyltransferase H [Parcubacteria group bacterium GW2011_GWB1_43_8b]OGM89689.1 MAG: 16S rRNA (cytosine(1402)-N(4))-methyltransferase [Candidatus Wolfebacteria bacterium GWA1_42_9]
MPHLPVLLKETIEHLNLRPGKFIIDGTVNGGGHSAAILEKILPGGTLLAVDWDEGVLNETKGKFAANSKFKNQNAKLIFTHDNYVNIPQILKKEKLPPADGLLLDLGFSSFQIEEEERGFSFRKDEVLDMRYDTSSGSPAYEIINSYPENELADIFYKYGEERFSRKIAKNIVLARKKEKITTTGQLVKIINNSVLGFYKRAKISPATRVFQALRIFTNHELDNLEGILKNLPKIIKTKGRCVIISFHSLEDRIVKNYFRNWERAGAARVVSKKVIRPQREEIINNLKSRSAKLRTLELV